MRAVSPNAGVNDWRWWALGLIPAFLVLTALIETPRFLSSLIAPTSEPGPNSFYDYASCWGSWILLGPAVFWFFCRFPLAGRDTVRNIPLHVVAGVAFIAVHLALHASADFLFSHPSAGSFAEYYLRCVRYLSTLEVIIFVMLNGGFHAVRFAIGAGAAAKRERELEHLKTAAELEALRRRLEPHFLFNALNSLCAMLPEEAPPRKMATRLADYLRLVLDRASSEKVSLREELALVHSYLEIESVRHGPRLTTKFCVCGDVMNAATPVLVLQPLVENAVRHATADTLDTAEVVVRAGRAGGALRLTVSNSHTADGARPFGEGHGHAIIRQRLEANYGAAAEFHVVRANGLYSAEIVLPFEVTS